jgi:hypothetical protein
MSEPAKSNRIRSWTLLAVVAAVLGLAASPALAAAKGFVDKSAFVELAGGDDAVRVEVAIHKSLIGMFCAGLDADLKRIACGLDSIDAVVLDVPGGDRQTRATEVIRKTEKTLKGRGWERVALVREEDSEVHVLILNDEDSIEGLVVMVMDKIEGELVFVNIAGLIDLEAIQRIAGEWNIPGLEGLDLEERP